MAHPSLEEALREEETTLLRVLEGIPEFRRLAIVRRTLEDLKALRPSKAQAITDIIPTSTSAATAATKALEEVGHPLRTREILVLTPRYGKVIGGKDPATNLSNTLSSDKKFASVMWMGQKAWWFTGQDVPTVTLPAAAQ